MKFASESEEVRTWAEARALCCESRQAWSSWMERTPSTFSRSCFTSSRLTPRGTLSRRIEPLFLTVQFVNIIRLKRIQERVKYTKG